MDTLRQRFIALLESNDKLQKQKLVYLYNNWKNKPVNQSNDSLNLDDLKESELLLGIKNGEISEEILGKIVDNYEIE